MARNLVGGAGGVLLKSVGTGAPDVLNTTAGIDVAIVTGYCTNTDAASTEHVILYGVPEGTATEDPVNVIWEGDLLPGTSSPRLAFMMAADQDLRGECTTDDLVTAFFSAMEFTT